MLTENQLRALADPIAGLFQDLEIRTIEEISRHIGEIGKITATDIHRLEELGRIGFDTNSILKDVAATTSRAETDVYDLLNDTLRREYDDYKLPNKVGFDNNPALKNLIDTISRETSDMMLDFSKTVGFVNTKGDWKPLAQAYQDIVDKAVLEIRTGTEDFHGAMRRAIKNLADNGIVSRVDYESGYRRRLDSSIRNAIMGAQQRLSMEQAKLVGEQFGADGMEITWHGDPRPSHEDMGGRQYSMKEFHAKIEPLLHDPNCYHRAFPIILGVSKPAYTDDELDILNSSSKETFVFEGKTYDGYAATQKQRDLETAIRREKERAIAFKNSGDEVSERIARAKVQALQAKYRDFSDAAGLSVKGNRTGVPGFSGREKIASPINIVRAAETSPLSGTRGHLVKPEHLSQKEFAIESIRKELSVSEEVAERYYDMVNNYTGGAYNAIRAAQINNQKGAFLNYANEIEDYIDKAPKWDNGSLYRGIKLNSMDASRLKPGQILDMQGVSSWTSAQDVAEGFTSMGGLSKTESRVVFTLSDSTTNYGTSIRHLSGAVKENEVLLSKDALFEITSIEKVVLKKETLYRITVRSGNP